MKLPQTPELLVARRIVSACLPALMALVVVLALATLARACPNCASGEQERAGGDIVSGYFWSILFMLAMPFTILGSFSGYMYYLVRKDRAARAAAGEPQTSAAQRAANRSLPGAVRDGSDPKSPQPQTVGAPD